jgi:hypothetical protein
MHAATDVDVDVNITVPEAWGIRKVNVQQVQVNGSGDGNTERAPPGGLFVRVRLPQSLGLKIATAVVNGVMLPASAVDAAKEAVHLSVNMLTKLDANRPLRLMVRFAPK